MQILPGNYSLARLRYLIRGGKGQVEIDTVDDGKLNVTTNGPATFSCAIPRATPLTS